MNTLSQIKDWAERGWNQEDVAQALGLTRYKLRLFMREQGYAWPKCKSIAFRERAKSWKPVGDPKNVTRLNRARQASLVRYTVNGVTGTRRELIQAFAVVPVHTVDVRIARGWTLEDALFTPARSKPADSHPWRDHIPDAALVNTLSQIKDWAERGWSQEDCAQAMGLSYNKFREFLRLQTGFKWPKVQTIAQRSAICYTHSPAQKEATRKAREAKSAKLPRYVVRGITGTYRELAHHFKVVSAVTVWRRLGKGWDIEKALFTPSQKRPSDRENYSAINSFGNYGGI